MKLSDFFFCPSLCPLMARIDNHVLWDKQNEDPQPFKKVQLKSCYRQKGCHFIFFNSYVFLSISREPLCGGKPLFSSETALSNFL